MKVLIRDLDKASESKPLQHSTGLNDWFNAYDNRDVAALVALDAVNFGVDPQILNKSDVQTSPTTAAASRATFRIRLWQTR